MTTNSPIKKIRYECTHEGCTRKWETKEGYKRHLATAHNIGVVWYSCPHDGCDFKTKTKGNVPRHAKNSCRGSPDRFPCTECPHVSKTRWDLTNHMRTHGEKTLQCSMCSEKFKHPSTLREHMAWRHNYGNVPGFCNCGRKRSTCVACLGPERATQMARKCNLCAVEIAPIRTESKGGNGFCNSCEQHIRSEAADNGSTASIKKCMRWEAVVFEQLLPLITYADGSSFLHDQRDERKGGGLGTSKVVKGKSRECDTSTNRFPDCLYILRDEHGHAVLVISIEVDEHSHGDREPTCESAKIDDSNVAVQQLLLKEFAPPDKPCRDGAAMVPFVVIKVNPNAYDGPLTNLADRVQAVADLVNWYVRMPATERAALPTCGPIVHVMYYHSKKGAKNLAHLVEAASKAGWTLHGH